MLLSYIEKSRHLFLFGLAASAMMAGGTKVDAQNNSIDATKLKLANEISVLN